MRNYAVICEFNPFHSGHKNLIDSVRECADNIVCVMSGQFVQSCSPAICDKSIRVESALLSGVDAVVELPAVYATASARSFAEGSLRIISKIKDVTNLAFGASSDKNIITRLADIKIKRSNDFTALLKSYLKQGKSYNYANRAAFVELYRSMYGEADPSPALDDPNSILGIEYICAIDKMCANIEPTIITRRGDYLLNEYYCEKFTSATNIRKSILSGDKNVEKFIPYNYKKIKKSAEIFTPDIAIFKKMALFSIKSLEAKQISNLRDCSDGMEFSVKEIAKKSNYDDVLNSEQLKIYGNKRIKRLLFDALCNIKKEHVDSPFITRLLGCAKRFDFSILPDFVKSTNREIKDAANNSPMVKSVLDVDERVTSLYNTLCSVDGDYYNYSLVKV